MKRTWAFTMVIAVLAGLSAWGWHGVLAPHMASHAAIACQPHSEAVCRGEFRLD